MTTDYIPADIFLRLLETLTPQNELVLELCLITGMRITDALMMTAEDAKRLTATQLPQCSYLYSEKKTGKEREVTLSRDWLQRAIEQHRSESPWLFAGRDPQKHRTRQAVWKDLHRAARLYRVNGRRLKARVGPHTARKVYAVKLYQEAVREGLEDPLGAVKEDLNHSDPAVTFIYALADVISARKQTVRHKNQVDNFRKVNYN